MATAGGFAASSEEEIAKILPEKDAENTKGANVSTSIRRKIFSSKFLGLSSYILARFDRKHIIFLKRSTRKQVKSIHINYNTHIHKFTTD